MLNLVRYPIRQDTVKGIIQEILLEAPPNTVFTFDADSQPVAKSLTDTSGWFLHTLDELRSVPTSSGNTTAILSGEVTRFDGRPSIWGWDNLGSDADNGASVVRPDDFTVAGIWRKLF